jgi:hypothetical protein
MKFEAVNSIPVKSVALKDTKSRSFTIVAEVSEDTVIIA